MTAVGPPTTNLVDKLTWYNSQKAHTAWDRFSREDQERMLHDDLSAGTSVSMVLGALITMGLALCIVSVLIVLATQ